VAVHSVPGVGGLTTGSEACQVFRLASLRRLKKSSTSIVGRTYRREMQCLHSQVAFQRPAHQSCSLLLRLSSGWLSAYRGYSQGAEATGMCDLSLKRKVRR
jgi:hypothetical protein